MMFAAAIIVGAGLALVLLSWWMRMKLVLELIEDLDERIQRLEEKDKKL